MAGLRKCHTLSRKHVNVLRESYQYYKIFFYFFSNSLSKIYIEASIKFETYTVGFIREVTLPIRFSPYLKAQTQNLWLRVNHSIRNENFQRGDLKSTKIDTRNSQKNSTLLYISKKIF